MDLKRLLSCYSLEDITASNEKELKNLWFNAEYFGGEKLKEALRKDKENTFFLLRGREWSSIFSFGRALDRLKDVEDYESLLDDEIKEIMKHFVLYDDPWEYWLFYDYMNSWNLDKMKKLLKGLKFNEDLLIKERFLSNISDKGIENFRKLYGSLPKSPYTVYFLNITDDVEFLKTLPKEKTGYNDKILENYTFEELKDFRDETYSDDNFFQYVYDEYLYKEYEEELLKFNRENKEFLDNFSSTFLPRDIGKTLKILRFWKKHEDILIEGAENYCYSIYGLIEFLDSYFTISDDEEKLLKVMEKIVEKSLNIQNLFRKNRDTFECAYVFDIILMLDNKVGIRKLEALCKYASHSGLDDETLKEITKTKYKNADIAKETLKVIHLNQKDVFQETFGMSTEDYRIKRNIISEVKEEDREKIDYLLNKGYSNIYVYSYLFAIDNICYLIKNGYKLEEKYWWCVKRFFTKEVLNEIIKYKIPMRWFMSSNITTIEQDLLDAIKRKKEEK